MEEEKDPFLAKILKYCAYQERCSQEVREKLGTLGADPGEVEAYVALLVQEGFLDDTRFARIFAHGKFSQKGWGKRKIAYQMRQKGLSDSQISEGLAGIDRAAYRQALWDQASKKWKSMGGASSWDGQGKLYRYLLQRGFEPVLIREVLQRMQKVEE